jgi:uncharacterized protein HemX
VADPVSKRTPQQPGQQQQPRQPQQPEGPKREQPGQQRSGQPAAAQPTGSVDPHERIDGLRSWLGQVDRKLGLRTYLGAALGVLALAAGVAAIMLSLGTKEDAATEADVQDLREQLTGVEQSAQQAAEEDVQTISESLAELEDQLGKVQDQQGSLRDELSVAQDDIQDLRNQISDLPARGAGAAGQ